MHSEVVQFLQTCNSLPWLGATVYEVGSLDVNGQARHIVPAGWRKWVGFDLVAGPGVDHVGDAAELLPQFPQCDIVVSTEVLEHAPEWEQLLTAMCDRIISGGYLVLTCAGRGRKPHAADGSPGGPHPGEHYRNVTLDEVEAVTAAAGLMREWGEEGWPGDTRFVGRKQ